MADCGSLPSFPTRDSQAHKGSVGRVLIVAGSPGMSGAAVLAAEAALRTGAGLVTIAALEAIHPVLEAKTTCAMTRPIPDRDGAFGPWSLPAIEAELSGVSAVAIGPGLGSGLAARFAIRRLVLGLPKNVPYVLDADGLNAFAGESGALAALSSAGVLTPHPGEMGRLLGRRASAVQAARREALDAACERCSATALLKGAGTLIGQGGRRAKNATGNPGMATAGAGDALTGVIAALLAAGLPSFEAACLGAHLHGAAGDLAAERLGLSLTATDIIAALPDAIIAYRRRDMTASPRTS